MKLISKLFSKNRTIFFSFIALDLFVLFLHLLLGSQTHFFYLDFEKNFPTYYQSFKLIMFGGIFFTISFTGFVKREIKSFIIPLALVLIYLGFDELLQIHENIYRVFELFNSLHPSKVVEASMKLGYRSSLWILYYLPFILAFVFWCGYWLHHFQSKMKSNAWILAISSLSLLAVLTAEIFSSTGLFSESSYYWFITVEETAEMFFGSTLIFIGSKIVSKYTNSRVKI